MRKINFLVIVVFLILFIFIVNAIEQNESLVNETSNLDNIKEKLKDTNSTEQNIENSQNNEKGKAVTASFGVYLQIVG